MVDDMVDMLYAKDKKKVQAISLIMAGEWFVQFQLRGQSFDWTNQKTK
jgi:hypothetical protein